MLRVEIRLWSSSWVVRRPLQLNWRIKGLPGGLRGAGVGGGGGGGDGGVAGEGGGDGGQGEEGDGGGEFGGEQEGHIQKGE
jgi:hypothetical protein